MRRGSAKPSPRRRTSRALLRALGVAGAAVGGALLLGGLVGGTGPTPDVRVAIGTGHEFDLIPSAQADPGNGNGGGGKGGRGSGGGAGGSANGTAGGNGAAGAGGSG